MKKKIETFETAQNKYAKTENNANASKQMENSTNWSRAPTAQPSFLWTRTMYGNPHWAFSLLFALVSSIGNITKIKQRELTQKNRFTSSTNASKAAQQTSPKVRQSGKGSSFELRLM